MNNRPPLNIRRVNVSFNNLIQNQMQELQPTKPRKIWLEQAIEEHVRNNPNRDSVDIVSHFKLSADITLESLQNLIEQGKVIRKHVGGLIYGYTCV
jgi:hypothetical protein